MVYQITIDPITWDSAVAIGLFFIAVLPGLVVWVVKCNRQRTLFKPEYQYSQTSSAFSHEVEASENEQRVQLTLRMELNTYVEFVALYFDGQGTLPVIKGLNDWQWPEGKMPNNVLPPHALPKEKDPKGSWYWEYQPPLHRFRKARITIGLDFLATNYFEGYLFVHMTTVDTKKNQRLPFKVRARSC